MKWRSVISCVCLGGQVLIKTLAVGCGISVRSETLWRTVNRYPRYGLLI